MTFAPEIVESINFPSGDLYSDEPEMETYQHLQQMILLLKDLEWWWRDREDFFAAGNLSVYYSPRQRKSEHFRGPDFFVVLGVERKSRKSWVVWEEGGKYPNLIIEILSPATAEIDRGLKKEIYQEIFRTPEYFWFDPETLEFKGFQLLAGQYQELQPDENGRLWSQQLQLFIGISNHQIRFFIPSGKLVPTPEETAARMARKLRDLGVDPFEDG